MPSFPKVDHIVDELKRHLPGHGEHEKLDIGRAFVEASLKAGLVGVPYNITLSGHTNNEIANGVHFASQIFQMEDELSHRDKPIEWVHAESSKVALPARSTPSSANEENVSGNDETYTININIITASGTLRRIAMLDTGSDDEFISHKTVERASLLNSIQSLDTHKSWNGAQGPGFEAVGRLELSWTYEKGRKTWDTEFYVIHTEIFDVLLGKGFLRQAGAVKVDRSVLPIHRNKMSAEDEAKAKKVAEEMKEEQAKENERLLQEEKENN